MIKEITLKELDRLLQDGVELVDVREKEELKDGMIDSAKHWPLSSFGSFSGDVSRLRPTVFYCRSGMRSLKAAEIASQWTSQEVYTLQGGFLNFLKDKREGTSASCSAILSPTPSSSEACS